MECPVLEDTGFMFDEAAEFGELIQETSIHSSMVGGMAGSLTIVFIVLNLV
jgi:hypothetical protein